ncbi:hypothetical protein VTN00DRAFT_5725 [Thermoascus crustaceus]|uniref:uncharacterized protein n=1 Tax=Thermoascus crustaceus TaxID=5088 RepID=UPI003742F413
MWTDGIYGATSPGLGQRISAACCVVPLRRRDDMHGFVQNLLQRTSLSQNLGCLRALRKLPFIRCTASFRRNPRREPAARKRDYPNHSHTENLGALERRAVASAASRISCFVIWS